MRDFIEILQRHEIYDEQHHNKTNHEYNLNGNLIEFVSLDQPQKIRGRKRDLLYINEANELHYEDWQQLIMRTTGKAIIDYNPSDAFHWIYDKVIPREDCDFYKTTYKDNPFLEPEVKAEIERLQHTDEDYWRIYGLGERGSSRATIFQFSVCDKVEGNLISYGLDFGFTNDPTSLVAVYQDGNNLYIDELLYHTNLTNDDISDKLHELGLTRYDEIFADSAEPKSIEELYRKRWNVKPTAKGSDSIMAGIDMLKRYKLNITSKSLNAIKEFQNYKWQEDKNGNLLNRPVDNYNHCFVGDTLITTINGLVPIKDIQEGDLVLTTNGYKRVIAKFDNGLKQVVNYSMQLDTNYVSLTCTDSHKIKIDNKWQQAKKLKSGAKLYLHKSSMVKPTICIKEKDISAKALIDCIQMFGNITKEIYQRVIMFIILIVTLLIIELKTYLLLKQNYILDILAKRDGKMTKSGLKNFIKKESKLQRIGINRKLVGNGILSMVKQCGLIGSIEHWFAKSAVMNTKQDTLEFQSIAIKTVKQKPLEKEERVYDLMIEENHEYFANGILVHNCIDSCRYAVWNKLSKPNYGKYSIR